MFILSLFILICVGTLGLILSIYRTRRNNYGLNIIQEKTNTKKAKLEEQDTTDHIFNKSSKMVALTSSLDKNIMIKFVILMVFSGIIAIAGKLFGVQWTQKTLALIFLGEIICVIILPDKIKKSIIAKRIKGINNDLPFLIDIIAVCVQSGMTIERSLAHIATNVHSLNVDMAVMLRRAVAISEVSGTDGALEEMSQKIPSQEMRMLCTTLQQSIKFGSSVYQVLVDLSAEIRSLQLLSTEEKVAKLSSKMSVPMIIFIMLPLLFILAGPGIIGVMNSWSN
ncbi:TPA: type II secretion system F family protein [Enterobacter hormaechei]